MPSFIDNHMLNITFRLQSATHITPQFSIKAVDSMETNPALALLHCVMGKVKVWILAEVYLEIF